MELIQALSKGLSPFWLKKIGFGFTFLLCLILFLKLDFKHEKLDQIDLRHIQDSNFYDAFFADQRIPQLWKNGNYASLYNLNFPENYEFFKYKEQQFKERKARISRNCSKLPKSDLHVSHTSTDTTHGQYVVDPTDGLGMCRIAKVSSSAWLYRFKMLLKNGPKKFSQLSHSKLVNMHAHSHLWWNLTKEQQVGHFNGSDGNILSFVMVRHPFDRLVSAYYDKIIGKALKLKIFIVAIYQNKII